MLVNKSLARNIELVFIGRSVVIMIHVYRVSYSIYFSPGGGVGEGHALLIKHNIIEYNLHIYII